jgi:hypothetical protein
VVDFWEKDVDLLLPFEEDEPVAGDNYEEPEKQLREII